MVFRWGGQNGTIRTVGLVLGMLVVHLRVVMDSVCYCVYVSLSDSAEKLIVVRRHSRVTFRLILHALHSLN